MVPSLTQFLIVCPAVFIAGYIDAIAGGGGLISLPAYLLAGLPVHNAIATNKLGSCVGTAAATLHYARDGYIRPRLALACVPAALLGSSLGAELALLVPDRIFKVLMLFILPVVAWYVLRGRSLEGGYPPEELPMGRTCLLAAAISLTVGAYDGFYGPGTGTFLLLLLTLWARLDLRTAAGTTKVVNFSTNLAALTVFLLNGKVVYSLGLAAAVCSVAGNWLGAASFARRGGRLVKPLILLVLSLFFIKVVWELLS